MRHQCDPYYPGGFHAGFHKPHLPHIAPKKYFDMYPLEKVQLPDNASRHAPVGAPDDAWGSCSEWRSYKDVAAVCKQEGFGHDKPLDDDNSRRQRQAYYAAASFSDAQVGRVLEELERLGLDNNTVIALWVRWRGPGPVAGASASRTPAQTTSAVSCACVVCTMWSESSQARRVPPWDDSHPAHPASLTILVPIVIIVVIA